MSRSNYPRLSKKKILERGVGSVLCGWLGCRSSAIVTWVLAVAENVSRNALDMR